MYIIHNTYIILTDLGGGCTPTLTLKHNPTVNKDINKLILLIIN